MEGCVFQDLEKQNETLQESLKKYHQEQRTLLDKVNILQQQLSQVDESLHLTEFLRHRGLFVITPIFLNMQEKITSEDTQKEVKKKQKQKISIDKPKFYKPFIVAFSFKFAYILLFFN